ncbi:hypothetical protein B0T25DRAFT_576849 [Lasiosphaeria hispida]|uniref:Heterokaryon incompatibility domain-containing protein n=1 Tax=Lasiosphaeria hispida TaxID=260671 RepID=A0AAJ0HXB8_9PEZI|nr:hypothetical protein B0T25DRAFT_576849 [Lasiosphaeria hispida]
MATAVDKLPRNLARQGAPASSPARYPMTAEKAADDIRRIRENKGLENSAVNTSDLEAALVLLADQLYQKSTHFLLELIQNADDNSFSAAETTPRLHVHYDSDSRRLLLSCNERGFHKGNVEAICAVGQSTKANKGDGAGGVRYIGEKGVGFKSVFKVADVTWIKSGKYSFKFDRRERLGMITPIWDSFPLPVPEGNDTLILLDLSAKCDVTELLAEIRDFDHRSLLFLRALKQLVFSITEKAGENWKSTITRKVEVGLGKGWETVELHHGTFQERFLVTKYQAEGLPAESKREGLVASEIRLAFPISHKGVAQTGRQRVYAFLPIRDYGFKFVIQADFLLVANREDIDRSSAWNQALLRSLPDAFLTAAQVLNSQDLYHVWPKFLQPRPHIPDFFEDLDASLLEKLSQHPVLRSASGHLKLPRKLLYAPQNFRDSGGNPFTLCGTTSSRYLARLYSVDDWGVIQSLGVLEMTSEGFVQDLCSFVETHFEEFQAKTLEWHSDLSLALVRIIGENASHISVLKGIRVIRLMDGRWVSANEPGLLLFPAKAGGVPIPPGLDILEVHQDIDSDTHKEQLLANLGVENYSVERICNRIGEYHATMSPLQVCSGILASDIVRHGLYAFHADWAGGSGKKMWFIAEDGALAHGEDLYLTSCSTEPSPHDFPKELESEINYLHGDYLAPLNLNDRVLFTDWAAQKYSVNLLPRLVTPTTESPFSLSTEFKILLSQWTGIQVLEFLKANWSHYTVWLGDGPSREPRDAWEESKQRLLEVFRNLQVECLDGKKYPLEKTTLPFQHSRKWAGRLPSGFSFLNVANPEDTGWVFLTSLGVAAKPNISALLERLSGIGSASPPLDEIANIYRQIQVGHQAKHLKSIKSKFHDMALVHVHPKPPCWSEAWFSPRQCIWDGGKYLRKVPVLKAYYPELGDFICGTLEVGNETLITALDELRKISPSDDLPYITQVFKALNGHLQRGDVDSTTDEPPIGELKLFPVSSKPWDSSNFDVLMSGKQKDVWFIADRHHLRRSFEGAIPLLAFSVEEIGRMGLALTMLGVECRLLSKQVKEETSVSGNSRYDWSYTSKLRRKVKFIASLLPAMASQRQALVQQLKTLEVHEAERVVVEWSVKTVSGSVTGKIRPGKVKMVMRSGTLLIYLTKQDLDAPNPPYELGEELRAFCGIQDAETAVLLQHILLPLPEGKIRQLLERKGIIMEDDDGDDGQVCSSNAQAGVIEELEGRGENNGKDNRSNRLLDLVRDIEGVSSMDRILSQRWKSHSSGEIDPLLTRVCQLDNQDTSILLPGKDIPGFGKRGGGFDMDGARILQPHHVGDVHSLIQNMNSGSIIWPAVFIPSTEGSKLVIFGEEEEASQVDTELSFLGEFMVSRMLEKHLPSIYRPEQHWTSPLRTRAGLEPCESLPVDASTFTILDGSGELSRLLRQPGCAKTEKWASRCTFHIHVVTTASDLLETDFLMGSSPMRKAESLWLDARSGGTVKDVFVLAVTSNARVSWQISLFVDPWDLHTQGKLRLGNVAHYMAQFERDTPYIPVRDLLPVLPAQAAAPAGQPGKERRLKRLQKFSKKIFKRSAPYDGPEEDVPYGYKPLAYRDFRLLKLSPGEDHSPLHGTLVHHSLPSTSPSSPSSPSPPSSPSSSSRATPPTYMALSYQWGSDLTPFKLSMREGSIEITLSLDRALRRVRDPARTLLVWADALCINQSDKHEKRVQIRLMKDIFESASEVCAYLGPGDEASDRAMETLIQICAAANPADEDDGDRDKDQRDRRRRGTMTAAAVATSLRPIPASWEGRGAPGENDPVWKDIRKVLDRGWFHRVWVVQEAVLARELVLCCGDWSVRWEYIWEAIRTCMALPGFLLAAEREHGLEMPAYTLGLVRERFRGPAAVPRPYPYDLLTLLHVFAHTQASCSVDKLFGLLSLASDAGDAAFDPDYHSPMERVAQRYATAFVKHGHAVKLLCRASGLRSPGLPSWVPDWTCTTRRETISTWYGARGLFTASKRSRLDASVDGSGGLRVMKATRLAKISSVGSMTSETSNLFAFLASIYSDMDALLLPAPGTYPPTGETRHQLALSLPVGGTSRPHPAYHHATTHRLDFSVLDGDPATSAFLNLTDNAAAAAVDKTPSALLDLSVIPVVTCIQDILDFLKQPPPARQNVWSYWQTATSFSRRLGNARFFAAAPAVTGTGAGAAAMRVGLGPGETEVGDELWIVHGMATPVVLRPRPRPLRMTAEEVERVGNVLEYELVGEAYIHDPRVMYGEALESMGGCSEVVALV